MHHRARLAVLLLPLLGACQSSSSFAPSAAPRQTASAPKASPPAASAASASSAAPAPAPPLPLDPAAEARQIMLQAAASDLTQPFRIEYPEPKPSPYRDYARRLGVPESITESAELVTFALDRMGPEGRQALVDWGARPGTQPKHRYEVYSMLRGEPRPGDLPVFKAMLHEPGLADEVTVVNFYGALSKAIGLRTQCSGLAEVLVSIAKVKTPEGRAVLLEYANDRSLTEPNLTVLKRMECPRSGRSEVEARALGSVRLWALSLLEAPNVWQQVADDKTEPEWLRAWVHRFSKGEPLMSRNSPQWRRRSADMVKSPCLGLQ